MIGELAWLANLGILLMAATLVGLFATGRLSVCPTFAVYLGLSLLHNRLGTWWPDTATLQFWLLFERLLALLGLLVVVEVSGRALALPRARSGPTWAVGGVGLLAAFILAGAFGFIRVPPSVVALEPFSLLGLYLTLLVAVHRQAPLHPLHRVILVTFALSWGTRAVITLLFDPGQRFPTGYSVQALWLAVGCATSALWALAAWAPTTTFDLPE